TPGAPWFPFTLSQAFHTSTFEMSNGLPDDFCLSTRLLLGAAQLLERTQPRTTRPLRSTPITGASSLLRAGPPACPRDGTHVPTDTRSPAACVALPLAAHWSAAVSGHAFSRPAGEQQTGLTPPSTPDTAWPIDGHPPGSSRDSHQTPVLMSSERVSMLQQWSSSQPPPDASRAPFPH